MGPDTATPITTPRVAAVILPQPESSPRKPAIYLVEILEPRTWISPASAIAEAAKPAKVAKPNTRAPIAGARSGVMGLNLPISPVIKS